MEPSFQYKSITKKSGSLTKNKENNAGVSWIDSILWNMFNILMYITLIKKIGRRKRKKKYSVDNLPEHIFKN